MTEDCLFLNVHVPKYVDLSDSSALPEDRLPVIFWIHGGSLQTGSGTSPRFDGRYLSNITNTIVVSTNYRVGKRKCLIRRETLVYILMNMWRCSIYKKGGEPDCNCWPHPEIKKLGAAA